MKLILLQGDLKIAVENKLSEIKKNFDNLSITEMSDSFNPQVSSGSLFSQNRLVILENPDLKSVEKALEESDPSLTIVLKFSKFLDKSSPVLKKLSQVEAEIIAFNVIDQNTIFPFLDMLGSKNKSSLKEFEKNYNQFTAQYLLTMLAYFLRRMVQKPKSASSFMLQKLNSQKKNFPKDKIRLLFKEVIETDFKIKQGLIDEKLGLTILINKIIN